MEFKINEYQLPEKIQFNYEELKAELTTKVSMYTNLVYTDEQIKDAKADKANLNKLKKALNDERIRLEKEYMDPFNDFKAKVNEIIAIIAEPVALIDKQVKEYEEKQKKEKEGKIHFMIDETLGEESPLYWLEHKQIWNDKWLNASTSMKSIQDEITARLEQIQNDLAALSNLPEFSFEATEVYKTTLDMNKAISEGHRLSEMAKRKAEHDAMVAREKELLAAKKAELEARQQEEVQTGGTITNEQFAQAMNPPVEEMPVKQWIAFSACMTTEDAIALREFFNSRNIEFKRV